MNNRHNSSRVKERVLIIKNIETEDKSVRSQSRLFSYNKIWIKNTRTGDKNV